MLLLPYYFIFSRVRTAARDTRRIEALAHSPVYTFFGDVLAGRETIRAYGVQARFERKNLALVARMAIARYANEACNKWAQALTTQTGCGLYLACGVACVFLNHAGRMTAGQFGLVLLYAGQLQRAGMDYMMGIANLETQFVSVERIAEYMRLEQEDDGGDGDTDSDDDESNRGSEAATSKAAGKQKAARDPPPPGWPSAGALALRGLRLRYRIYRPLVLKGLSLDVPAGAKVAVCGRTGSGKSTMFAALAGLYPLSGGTVAIDGVDVARVPLPRLRAALRVVTQDPVLFSGTLRENLVGVGDGDAGADAGANAGAGAVRRSVVGDDAVWRALAAVRMDEKVRRLPGGLGFGVAGGGASFSVGERQLLCTARALISGGAGAGGGGGEGNGPPRVFLCDEATANVDLATDDRLHDVLLGLDATVVMICHRLNHIRRFDTVVVLEAGRVAEEGAPAALLARASSRLSALCAHAGLRNDGGGATGGGEQ